MYFLDANGFDTVSPVPYAWQKIGEALGLPACRSRDFRDRLLSWRAQGIVVAYLPPYSPELNHIELLWRKMKYEWLPLGAWDHPFTHISRGCANVLIFLIRF